MAQAKKFEMLMARAEEEGLSEEEMLSASMSLLSARRKSHGGGRPAARPKFCQHCGAKILGGIKKFLEHKEKCAKMVDTPL